MTNFCGWAGRALNVDLSKGQIKVLPLSIDFALKHLGGRGFATAILYDRVGPDIEPLSPNNIVAISSGVLSGTLSPGACRTDIVSKSSESGIFGRSNLGGFFGPELKWAGYDLIVLSGQSKKPVYLRIEDDLIELRDAGHLWGKDTWTTQSLIRQELGDRNIKTLKIGPAGENGVGAANVVGDIGRSASKGGIGAILGSKKLKAITVRGRRGIKIAKPKELLTYTRALWERFKSDPMYETHVKYGRNSWVGDQVMKLGGNWFPNLSAQGLQQQYKRMLSCSGCALHCGHFYRIENGNYKGTTGHGIEGNCQIFGAQSFKVDDSGFICHYNTLCNKLGLDLDMPASALGCFMRVYKDGLISRDESDGFELKPGNPEMVLAMVRKMAYNEGFGKILNAYPNHVAEKFGRGIEMYVSLSKGKSGGRNGFSSSIKATLAHNVATRGWDHLTGSPTIETPNRQPQMTNEILERLGRERYGDPKFFTDCNWNFHPKYALRVWEQENAYAMRDLTGSCNAVGPSPLFVEGLKMADYAHLIAAVTGVDFKVEDLVKAAERELLLERAFNAREGIRRVDDLPYPYQWLLKKGEHHPGYAYDKLPMSLEEYGRLLDEYYLLRGCDTLTGIPTRAKLEKVGLNNVSHDLNERGILG
ncbi:hypothetical protein C4544_05980 [candidate division WS5 bacterium]|jgi:aldehyde:ferredoxin oxidoreductase|uniref:Aldehyde ferredoxin oxidoreductase N-terminal domain-containing protein n=1 Tax=candidate division WS5 bacterium TaxID=2093353 RepID=A0A419DAS7_9BACT|nr:MAG: hypothetical protein C4544_05980 [candidate division WS5 bacterium]